MIALNHHAYLVVGGRQAARDLVDANGVDFHEWAVTSFGIEEARELRAKQQRTSVVSKKIFLVMADSITHEAQNALLKTLEEPTANTFIFISVPSAQSILPTLLSRVVVIEIEAGESNLTSLAQDFLTAKISDRFDLIEQIIGKGLPGLPQTGHPDRARGREFVALLAKSFRQKFNPESWTKDQAFAAEELIKAEKYLSEPASLAKMILEHLALILPAAKV